MLKLKPENQVDLPNKLSRIAVELVDLNNPGVAIVHVAACGPRGEVVKRGLIIKVTNTNCDRLVVNKAFTDLNDVVMMTTLVPPHPDAYDELVAAYDGAPRADGGKHRAVAAFLASIGALPDGTT